VTATVASSQEAAYTRDVDASALGDIELPDADGRVHRLGELWGERPVVLVFLRHFG